MVPAARDFFLNGYAPRGPWPTLRIGRQPYGIVPGHAGAAATSRARATSISAPLLALLESLRPTWQAASTQVPRVGLGSDPDATLAGVLGMSPRSETYVGRSVLGPQYNEYYWRFLAKPIDAAWWTRLGQLATSNLRTLASAAAPDPTRQLHIPRQALQSVG